MPRRETSVSCPVLLARTGRIGAPLGLIEIFKPKLADKIEDYLDFMGAQNEEGEFERMAQKYVVRFQMLALIAFPLIILLIYHWLSNSYNSTLPRLTLDTYWLVSIWIIVILAFSGILFYMLGNILKGPR